MAAGPEFKKDIKNYLAWTIRSIENEKNISIHKNVEMTSEMLEDSDYDVVIVSIGSEPLIPAFAKKDPKIAWVGDVEQGKVQVGNEVVIVGAGLTGCESSLALANEGKKVTLVDMIPAENFGCGGAKFNQIALMDMLKHKKIRMIGEVKLATRGDEIGFENLKGEKVEIPYDNLILSLGVRPNQKKIEDFSKVNKEIIFIGDCSTRIGTLFHAVHTGHEAASVL